MDNDFLEAFIQLEKICGEIYNSNHGVSKYIEDMEEAGFGIHNKIPGWTDTYKRLKNIRWKRNQLVHENNVKYNSEDIVWLDDFYRLIISGEDPLSQRRKFLSQTKSSVKSKSIAYVNDDIPYKRKGKSDLAFWLLLPAFVFLFLLLAFIGKEIVEWMGI